MHQSCDLVGNSNATIVRVHPFSPCNVLVRLENRPSTIQCEPQACDIESAAYIGQRQADNITAYACSYHQCLTFQQLTTPAGIDGAVLVMLALPTGVNASDSL